MKAMSESNNIPNQESALAVSLTVGQLKVLFRDELEKTVGKNGHRPSEAPRPYLTVKEAAEMARLAPSAIRLFIRKRELKAHKVGSRVIIKRIDLEGFLEAHPMETISG